VVHNVPKLYNSAKLIHLQQERCGKRAINFVKEMSFKSGPE